MPTANPSGRRGVGGGAAGATVATTGAGCGIGAGDEVAPGSWVAPPAGVTAVGAAPAVSPPSEALHAAMRSSVSRRDAALGCPPLR